MRKQLEGSGGLYTPGECSECRAGEHGDNGDGNYHLYTWHDGHLPKKAWLCTDHEDLICSDYSDAKHVKSKFVEVECRDSDDV